MAETKERSVLERNMASTPPHDDPAAHRPGESPLGAGDSAAQGRASQPWVSSDDSCPRNVVHSRWNCDDTRADCNAASTRRAALTNARPARTVALGLSLPRTSCS